MYEGTQEVTALIRLRIFPVWIINWFYHLFSVPLFFCCVLFPTQSLCCRFLIHLSAHGLAVWFLKSPSLLCLHSSLHGSLLSYGSVTSRQQESKLLAEGEEWSQHIMDILADMLPRAIVILHQYWTLTESGERWNHLLPPPSFVFSLIIDWVGQALDFLCLSPSQWSSRGSSS